MATENDEDEIVDLLGSAKSDSIGGKAIANSNGTVSKMSGHVGGSASS